MKNKYQSLYDLINAVRIIQDDQQSNQLLSEISEPKKPIILSFINAHGFNLSWRDEAIGKLFLASDILLRDGSGMKILYKALDREPGLNMNGTDFIPELISCFKDQPVVVFGTESPWLEKGVKQVTALGAQLVGYEHGFHDESHYLQRAKELKPALIVLAMGMPRQERISIKLRETLNHPCLIVNGGAIIDFLANRFSRAPGWMRRLGLEWLYRLILEPKRMFNRYVMGNVLFLWRIVRLKANRSTN